MGLNATVTPGLTVTSSTVISAANLNLLGTPTVSITGAIDSSDVGANTIGNTQIQDNAVNEAKIGNIGGVNYILRGDSSNNGQGIPTVATGGDDNSEQISLLVNDTSTLKARFITGSLDVTADTSTDTLGLTIKDDTITNAMLKNDAVKAHIGNIQPGGGKTSNGGEAAASAGDAKGGLIVFDPNTQDSIGEDDYYGKAKVIQPSAPGQALLSSGSNNALSFGTIQGLPLAYCQGYAPTFYDADSHLNGVTTNLVWNINFHSNIHLMKWNVDNTFTRGRMRVFFAPGTLASGDNVGVFGLGVTEIAAEKVMPSVIGAAGIQRIDANGNLSTDEENDSEYPYVDVVFIYDTENTVFDPSNASAVPLSETRNPNILQMTFYKY